MTTRGTTGHAEHGGADRALRWIGDLDHPFYSDERNRYVWYEASAIAFQMLFLASYFVAGLLLWIGGADALIWVVPMFVPTVMTAGVFQAYLKRHSAEYWPTRNDFGRRRGQIAILAAVVLLTGLIRAAISLQDWVDGEADSFVGGTATGMIVGLFVGPMAAAAVLAYKARSSDRDDDF